MSSIIFNIFYLFLLSNNVNSANILGLFPHTGKSHHMVFEPLLTRLAERGHNMTVASFFPMKNPPKNFRDISFQGIAEIRLESFDLSVVESQNILYKVPILGRAAKQIVDMSPFAVSAQTICERLVNFEPLLEALKSDYDLVFLENFTSDCMLGLLYVYGITAPVVTLVSGSPMPWTIQRVGVVSNPSHIPIITSPFTSQMSLLERVENTIVNLGFSAWYNNEVLIKERRIIEKKFGDIPDLRDLARNTSAVFLNAFHVLNGVKPLVPGLVEVGGMHLPSQKKPIPQFIEKFLNESKNGVVLFSLGSHIKTTSLSKYKEQIFVNALSKLKQRVIWKYEDSGEEGTLTSNILRVKWLPQYELLQHEKVIAFICHGGMLGMTEAVAAGKPMVVVPFFGDQPNNAAAAFDAGIARVLSYADLTEEALTNALQDVLSEKMVSNARRVSQMWHDRPSSPLDTAVYFSERAIRWGNNARLYSAARDLPFYQLALIDVAIIIIITILVFLTLIFYLIRKILLLFMIRSKVKVN